jgi:muconolactone delta-isomerase
MLALIEADVDYAGLGDRKAEIFAAEHAATLALIHRGVALGEWRKADGSGVICVWSVADRAELDAILAGLPIRPWLPRIVVRELAEHPLFPGGRLAEGPA